ncbi:hypothetical protein D9C73_028172 [Collichthys lucidus]|uniref:Uncharacterized protein n=1 Tax=Collichthys lucidus TaxID=240159 RepID=A0A4U5TVT1_COLLU|nr:hypothetical protein D9C73_028172 [Collichthys lucidus]
MGALDCTHQDEPIRSSATLPGSVHDSRVFGTSEIYQRLSQVTSLVCCWETGGLPASLFFLTPFKDPQQAQQAYSHAHARTRARAEMTSGLLKQLSVPSQMKAHVTSLWLVLSSTMWPA